VSQNDLPEPKPDLMLKAWGFLLAGRASAVLVALAMVLTATVVIKLLGIELKLRVRPQCEK
jgi:hypothetical protein